MLQLELGVEVGVLAVAVAQVAGLEEGDEDLDEVVVELAAGHTPQFLDRLRRADRKAVGVARGHHVVDVGDGQDPGEGRDVVARQAARVAGAVEALVVGEDDVGDRPVALDPGRRSSPPGTGGA